MKNFKSDFLKDFSKVLDNLLEVKEYEDFNYCPDEFHTAWLILLRIKLDLESNELQVIKTENLKEVMEIEDFLREKGEGKL
jgi:hypothetical protein